MKNSFYAEVQAHIKEMPLEAFLKHVSPRLRNAILASPATEVTNYFAGRSDMRPKIRDLLCYTRADVLKFNNVGKIGVAQLDAALDEIGFGLRLPDKEGAAENRRESAKIAKAETERRGIYVHPNPGDNEILAGEMGGVLQNVTQQVLRAVFSYLIRTEGHAVTVISSTGKVFEIGLTEKRPMDDDSKPPVCATEIAVEKASYATHKHESQVAHSKWMTDNLRKQP